MLEPVAHLQLRGRSLGPVQGVLFDKDGTLSHSEPRLIALADARITEALERFQAMGASESELSELHDLLARTYGRCESGVTPDGTLAVASRQHNLLSTATVFCQMRLGWPRALVLADEMFDAVDQHHQDKSSTGNSTAILPGAAAFLRELKAAGVVCALISNDTTAGIQSFIDAHQLGDCITDVWSADNHPSKPDPGAVHGLCTKLNLKASHCALIGDADTDLLMARQAGIGITLGYVAGWHQSPELTAHEHLIHRWSELTLEGHSNKF